jgi:Zn-dependent protease
MVTAPPQTTFSWQTTPFPEHPARAQGKVFSSIEIRDIIIAWLALGLAFSFVVTPGGAFAFLGGGVSLLGAAYLIGISLVTVGTGFVFHELSHKFVAQRYGYWAEFRMWTFGLVLAILTSFLGVIFAAPGATYISGTNISQAQNGKISLAGPLVNVVIAAIFLPALLLGKGIFLDLGIVGVRINVFLALFNMLPIGPLDGSKVFRWNLPLWAVIFVSLGIAFYFLYFVAF